MKRSKKSGAKENLLNVLIVEDNPDKSKRVSHLLSERLSVFSPSFTSVADYESAMVALSEQFFDLVILDLLIPGAGQAPSKDFSRSLITQLNDGRLVAPTVVIGLTEFKKAVEEEKDFYDENLFALELFSWTSDAWVDRLAKRITFLVRSKRAAQKFQINSYNIDVFIAVARYENEYLPIKEVLFKGQSTITPPIPNWNVVSSIGQIDVGAGRQLTACLTCVGEMGVAPTTAITTQAISLFRPRLVSMLGMCCGFNSQECAYPQDIGNVVVVRNVACWEEGKFLPGDDKDDFRNRSKPRSVSDSLERPVELAIEKGAPQIQKILSKFRSKKYAKDLIEAHKPFLDKDPKVRFASIVTGSSFVANSKKISEIVKLHDNAVALDMEIYGLYTAPAFVVGSKPLCLAIKGVADFGDGDDRPELQSYASISAALVFKHILGSIDLHSLIE